MSDLTFSFCNLWKAARSRIGTARKYSLPNVVSTTKMAHADTSAGWFTQQCALLLRCTLPCHIGLLLPLRHAVTKGRIALELDHHDVKMVSFPSLHSLAAVQFGDQLAEHGAMPSLRSATIRPSSIRVQVSFSPSHRASTTAGICSSVERQASGKPSSPMRESAERHVHRHSELVISFMHFRTPRDRPKTALVQGGASVAAKFQQARSATSYARHWKAPG